MVVPSDVAPRFYFENRSELSNILQVKWITPDVDYLLLEMMSVTATL